MPKTFSSLKIRPRIPDRGSPRPLYPKTERQCVVPQQDQAYPRVFLLSMGAKKESHNQTVRYKIAIILENLRKILVAAADKTASTLQGGTETANTSCECPAAYRRRITYLGAVVLNPIDLVPSNLRQ
ncbi:hypothetical protein EVAR_73128_1 [Eumeta japonica]|uniref:Uncharacterized protein n=1 Tax=Eumeta variegata TaxID=151549 RepID=A0A4C1T060_EUMVA|nr:hypothetical protein EVAR_73128_1 [Eumeta japonica]